LPQPAQKILRLFQSTIERACANMAAMEELDEHRLERENHIPASECKDRLRVSVAIQSPFSS
jgi:hypothetical protein